MQSSLTQSRVSNAFGLLFGDQLKAEAVLFYKKNGEWNLLEDTDEESGIDWGAAGQKFDYSNIALVPPASSIDFKVLNFAGKYSPGSGTPYDNVIDLDTPIKLQAGYQLPDLSDEIDEDLTLAEGAYGYHYFTKTLSGSLIRDVANAAGNSNRHFTDIVGSFGYFATTFAFSKKGLNQVNSFKVTADNTLLQIYYRVFNNRYAAEQNPIATTDWISAGFTVNGTKTVSFTSLEKYIQVAIVFQGSGYVDGIAVTQIQINYQSYVEWIYRSVFYLDSAEYDDPTAPEIPRISCAGRDLMKRALDQDINLPDMTGGVYLDDLLKSVLTQINMIFTPFSIANLQGFGVRSLATGLSATVKATTIFELIMQIITQSGMTQYFMFMRYDSMVDDNALFVQPKPVSFTDFMTFSRDFVSQIGFKRKSYDRLLQRMTIVSKKESLAANVLLASQAITASGVYTLSWTGNAEYKFYSVDVLDSFGDVELNGAHPVSPTSISFNVTFSGTPFILSVFGSKWSATEPTYQGESINNLNMETRRGITRELENPMLVSSNEARNIAEGFVGSYGNPQFDVGDVGWPFLNIFFDQNDPALIISNITFIKNVYYINGIKHHWSRSVSPNDASTFSLIDSGFTLNDFPDVIIWDGVSHWDSGLQFDLVFPLTQMSDPTNYDYLKPVLFS